MAIIPSTTNVKITRDTTVETSYTYGLDLISGRIYNYVDEVVAIQQFILKTWLTERYDFLIYDRQYGTEFKPIRTKSFSEPLLKSLLKKNLNDAVIYDARILRLYDWDMTIDGDAIYVEVQVDSIFGETSVELTIGG